MNKKEWKELDPDEQRIKIAELCGYYDFQGGWSCNSPLRGRIAEGKDTIIRFVPDYLNDLNVMHEAEKILESFPYDEHGVSSKPRYLKVLSTISGGDCVFTTAKQRAEAFVLVMTDD